MILTDEDCSYSLWSPKWEVGKHLVEGAAGKYFWFYGCYCLLVLPSFLNMENYSSAGLNQLVLASARIKGMLPLILAEAGRYLSLRPVWFVLWIPGCPETRSVGHAAPELRNLWEPQHCLRPPSWTKWKPYLRDLNRKPALDIYYAHC